MAVKIRKSKKKHSFKALSLSIIVGLSALGSLIFLGISNWRIYKDRQAISADTEKLENQIQVLQERQQMLKAGLSATQGEDFQEEKMREQGYKKPGEEVIAVLPDKANDATKQSGTTTSDNFWLNLWAKIKGVK